MLAILNTLLNSYTYVLNDAYDQSIIVDCGDIPPIKRNLHENGTDLTAVLLTHAHFDHIYGLNELLDWLPETLVYTNQAGKEMLLNAKKNMSYYHETPFVFSHPECIRIVADREIVKCGKGISAQAFFTPGHNPSCITWVIGGMVFSGDSLIPGTKTITNLPGGDKEMSLRSEEAIKQIARNKALYPGHHVG